MRDMKASYDTVRRLLVHGIEKGMNESHRQETKNALLTYLKATKSIADAYFHRIPSAEEYCKKRTFETDALAKIISRIDWKVASAGKSVGENNREIKFSLTGIINFDRNAKEVWIPWHRFIAGIVMDLLRNAVYAKERIGDPWKPTQNEHADLWVRVDYEEKLLKMTLANASKDGLSDVFPKLKKHRWSHLEDLGGKIETVELHKDMLGVQVKIPYAAYLG
jgi:hypothetical protein